MPDKPMQFDDVLPADRGRLITLTRKRQQFVQQNKPHDQLDLQLAEALAASRERYAARRQRHAAVAHPHFDDALPIAGRRNEIADLIRKHPVVILCGETGSGKTCLLYTSPSPRD